MYLVLAEILLVFVGFVLGFYYDHARDVAKGLRTRSPRAWWEVVKGMWRSKTIYMLIMLCIVGVGIYFLNTLSEKQTQAEMMDIINNSEAIAIMNENNENMDALIERIDKLISILEANGVPRSTTK